MDCVLIYNPVAGRNRAGRAELMGEIADALRALGHRIELRPTTAASSAAAQAEEAVRSGAQVVFACGGDGTIHEVIQGLASESTLPSGALGIIPLGSANALARHMRLSLDPMRAALQQIRSTPSLVPVGKIAFSGGQRYFTVMAGAGPDGALAYSLLASKKSSLGRLAYYLHAGRFFATRRFRRFDVTYTEAASGSVVSCRAVSVMAVRVGSLGGLFSRLAGRGGRIDDAYLQLLILRPPGLLSLPLWFLSGWLNLHRLNPFLHSVQAADFSCRPCSHPAPHFQADGECLGRIPIRVSIIPKALRILLPSQSAVEQRTSV
jgi:diacylglycerol kinase (ATP)